MIAAILTALGQRECPICGDRRWGWAALVAHVEYQHHGEA